MLSHEEKLERIELIDAVCDAGRLARGLDQLLESGRMIFSAARCRIVSERLMSPYSQCRGVPLRYNSENAFVLHFEG